MLDTSSTSPAGSPSFKNHNRSSSSDDDDLKRQMTGIFHLIDKDNTGYISIAQLEETIRGLVNEGHNPDFMEFIQSFGAYMETLNTLGKENVDVNKMDLDAFCGCTKNYMLWRRVRKVKRQDSTTFYLSSLQDMPPEPHIYDSYQYTHFPLYDNQSQDLPTPNGRFRISTTLLQQLQAKGLFPGNIITKNYTSYGEPYGTISVDDFIATIPNTPARELRMLVSQLDVDRDGYYSLDEFFDDVGGVDHVMIAGTPTSPGSEPSFSDETKVSASNGGSYRANAMMRGMSRELQRINSELERKCDAFQTEIQYLTVSVSKLETELQRKDKEIERLKKETKAVYLMQEAEKDFKSQVTTLSNQVNKNNSVIEDLRQQYNDERDRSKMLSEILAQKEEEIRKMTHSVKFQGTLQDKINALQQYTHELEQELEKERDKVLFYKNSYMTSPRLTDRRDSIDDKIPLFVRQSSFSASTPPLSVELLTHAQNPISPVHPLRLNFSPSPIANTSTTNLNRIRPTSPTLASTPQSPSVTKPNNPPGTPINQRQDVPPIPLNYTPASPSTSPHNSPPSSPTIKPSPISASTPPAFTSSPSSSSLPIPSRIPTPPPPPTPTSTSNVFLQQQQQLQQHLQLQQQQQQQPDFETASPQEDPALTSLRLQLWQLSAQLATTERLLAESQSRLEAALATPRITENAWGVLKYFCPTGIFCTAHD